MIFGGRRLGGGIALALGRHRMDQLRAMVAVADILQHRDQMLQIMPVDRPDIIESQFLEQGAAHRHAAREFVGLRSEEHTSELQSLMRISYSVFCLKKKKTSTNSN